MRAVGGMCAAKRLSVACGLTEEGGCRARSRSRGPGRSLGRTAVPTSWWRAKRSVLGPRRSGEKRGQQAPSRSGRTARRHGESARSQLVKKGECERNNLRTFCATPSPPFGRQARMPSLLCPPTIAGSDGQPGGARKGRTARKVSQAKPERKPGHVAASEGAIEPCDAGTRGADDRSAWSASISPSVGASRGNGSARRQHERANR